MIFFFSLPRTKRFFFLSHSAPIRSSRKFNWKCSIYTDGVVGYILYIFLSSSPHVLRVGKYAKSRNHQGVLCMFIISLICRSTSRSRWCVCELKPLSESFAIGVTRPAHWIKFTMLIFVAFFSCALISSRVEYLFLHRGFARKIKLKDCWKEWIFL